MPENKINKEYYILQVTSDQGMEVTEGSCGVFVEDGGIHSRVVVVYIAVGSRVDELVLHHVLKT